MRLPFLHYCHTNLLHLSNPGKFKQICFVLIFFFFTVPLLFVIFFVCARLHMKMKRHNAKAIAAAVAIAAAAPVEGKRKTTTTTTTTGPTAAEQAVKQQQQQQQNLNASALYVDVVKNISKPESLPPATPTPPPPSKFSIQEDFPALPGTPEAHVPDDWTVMISDDDDAEHEDEPVQSPPSISEQIISVFESEAEPAPVPDLLVELQQSSGSSSNNTTTTTTNNNTTITTNNNNNATNSKNCFKHSSCSNSEHGTTTPLENEVMPAVALVAATTDCNNSGIVIGNGSGFKDLSFQPNIYVWNGIFDKQFLAAGVGERAWSRQKCIEVSNNGANNIGPPPGFEHIKFYGRLRTNRMGVPLGGVTFDCAPPQRDARRWNGRPQQGGRGGIEGAYGLAGLAGRLEAAQQNPKLLSQIFGHDAAGLNVGPHNCAYERNKLYSSFASPLQGGRCTPHEVLHDVPLHYRRAGERDLPQPKTNQMEVELLFFFFYTYPGDMMQMLAAAELAERGWRFHIFERLWIRRQSDNPNYKRCGYQESGEYNYFNMVHWRILARHFDLMPQELERTITKSELREQYGYHPQMRWVIRLITSPTLPSSSTTTVTPHIHFVK